MTGEFVLLELMRLGATDRKQVERIRIKFQELDIKKNDVLDYDELCHGGYLIQAKSNPHFFSKTSSGTELVHITPQISSPFHEVEEGTTIPDHLLVPNRDFPEGEEEAEEEKERVREEVLEEIQKMQRVRSESIARLEIQDLLFYDDSLMNFHPLITTPISRRGSRVTPRSTASGDIDTPQGTPGGETEEAPGESLEEMDCHQIEV
jgi:hypothetical protein